LTDGKEQSRAGAQGPEEAIPLPEATLLTGTAALTGTGSPAPPGVWNGTGSREAAWAGETTREAL